MQTRRSLDVIVLIVLVVLLGYLANSRGLLPRLGAVPVTLDGPFLKEEAWIVDEIVRDITEMSAYPSKANTALSIRPRDGIYDIAISGRTATPVSVDLREDLWSPAQFATLARAVFAGEPARERSTAASPLFRQIVELTPGSLVTASAAVSRALAVDIRDWRAHESAALVLGAFALRESAGRFNDTRWTMNRMTAHLAVAAALRADRDQTDDGRLADAVLLILVHHQRRAVAALDALAAGERPAEMRAWTRALRLRLTGDTRHIDDVPSRMRLEQLEYFRAARSAAPRANGLSLLDDLGIAPTADWLRIIEASGVGVEDGDVIDQAMEAERAEANELWQRLHDGRLPDDWIAQLNVRASRLVGPSGPEVLPWGAWAEAAQRHIAMFVEKEDAFYRMTIGNEHEADSRKARLKSKLGGLRLFPIATMFWNKGPKGTEGDAGLIDDAITAAVAAPELVSPAAWARLALGTHYERVRRGMPEPSAWFAPIALRTGYEAARRVQEGSAAVSAETLAAMVIDAPYDSALANRYLSVKYGQRPPVAEVRRVFGPRLDDDIRAIRAARALVPEDAEESITLSQAACRLSPPECIALGSALIDAGRDSEAAASYERAFADPALDAVALSNSSDWLVNYYYRHGRIAAALALAERAASTGAYRGLVTVAHVYERLGRASAAEDAYRRSATGYDNWSQLIAFYYRAVSVRHETRFEDAWKMALARTFPGGLAPVTTSDTHPDTGVVVVKDSAQSRKAGLQAGDIVVGLEGWAVSNYDQYATINAFFDREDVKLTVWRGHLVTIDATAPNRLLGVEYRSYPVRGWAEKLSDRTTYRVLGALTALMLSAQIAIKPGLNADEVHQAAQVFGSSTAYNGMFVENFELPLRDKTTFRLADHVGRDIVVLNFFATWCEPCRAEMPELAAYAARHQTVRLIAIDVEERPEEVDAFITRLGLTLPVGIDARGAIARQFTVSAYPTTVVVGADGRIKLYQVGAIRNADAALNRVVDTESAALADGQHDWHAEYVAKSSVAALPSRRRDGFKPPDEAAANALSGRARSVAEAMPCPCGCDDRVIACDCHTSKGIKAALRAGVDASLTDRQVMEKLNKEFCMKGM